MTKGIKIAIAAAATLVIVGGVLVIASMKTNETSNPSAQSNTNTDSSKASDQTSTEEADVTITYNGSTFALSASTVKSGGTVKVENTSTKNLNFESDPHPAHTNNEELNAGGIEPGKSTIFTLTTKGKWGFHNHLNASQHGELTVE